MSDHLDGCDGAWSVKCDRCKKVEKSTPEEGKSAFAKSLRLAGWKTKCTEKLWLCPDCPRETWLSTG